MGLPIRAVIVDLDDTIYPQSDFLTLAWTAVAASGSQYGIPANLLRRRLIEFASEGSDQGRIIDRALESLAGDGVQVASVPVGELIEAFQQFRPTRLRCYPGVLEALAVLRKHVSVALISDGSVAGQQAKIAALGVADAFDAVVLSDALGREFRKPSPLPFRLALKLLKTTPAEAVMIGDRPDKDIAGAAAAGIRAVRVRTGEYAVRPDDPAPWASARDLPAAVELLLPLLSTSR